MPPFKPAKMTHYDRQLVDYVRCATAKNIWYYRCVRSRPATAVAAMRRRPDVGQITAAASCRWDGASRPLVAASYCYLVDAQHMTSHVLIAARSPPLLLCRDRMSSPRGPCSLPVLREAWTQGVIDENTLVWGQVRRTCPHSRGAEPQLIFKPSHSCTACNSIPHSRLAYCPRLCLLVQGLADWLPVKNVRTLVPQIRTVEGMQQCSRPLCGNCSPCTALGFTAHRPQCRRNVHLCCWCAASLQCKWQLGSRSSSR